jgi:hypothetical protein
MNYVSGFFKWVWGFFTKKPAYDSEEVVAIQNAAIAACRFRPAAETVANILVASPAVATASVIADGICAVVTGAPQPGAVTQMGLLSEPVVPTYNGVKIEGEFVK